MTGHSRDNLNAVRGYGPLDNIIAKLRHRIAYRKLKPYFPLKRCLDIGSGAYPAFLMGLDAGEKIGLEQSVSRELVNLAEKQGIRIVEHDVSQSDPLPSEDNAFDVVTMLAVIEHIEPQRVPSLLSEISRILKPGGTLMLTTPAAWTDLLLRTLAVLKLISREEIDDHKDVFTRKKLRAHLTDAGFHEVQTGTFECFMNLWAIAKTVK